MTDKIHTYVNSNLGNKCNVKSRAVEMKAPPMYQEEVSFKLKTIGIGHGDEDHSHENYNLE